MKITETRHLAMLLAFLLLFSLAAAGCVQSVNAEPQSPAADLSAYKDKTIFMHVGSPLILSGEEIVFLDPEDFGVAATIYKQRTLVPLRAVAEHFGADVSYDAKKHEAVISYDGGKFVFPIGTARYTATLGGSSEEITMDTEARLTNGRTLVPIRVIAEQLLKKNVDYKDGVIMISEETASLDQEAGLVDTVKSKIGVATKARSKEQLSSLMENGQKQYAYATDDALRGGAVPTSEADMNFGAEAPTVNEAQTPVMDSADGGGESGNSGSSSHSTTNTQVEGVDEADIVKTDGKYLYYAGSNALRIIRAEGPKLSEVSTIKLPDDKYVREIYVDGDRLVLLGNRSEYDGDRFYPMTKEEPAPAVDLPGDSPVSSVAVDIDMGGRIIYPGYGKSFAFADIYDIKDPGKPNLVKSHEMEGHYQSSRKSGDHLYLITNTGWSGGVLPLLRDTARGEKAVEMNIADIMVMPEPISPGYIVLSAINITDNSRTEVEAVTAHGSTVYMNESALYLAADGYDGTTEITKFKIDGMNIGYAGSGKVKGSLLNQFSMDEFEGNLRVATTLWEEGNNLFVLDGSLNVMGSVTGLAKGETIYSVRFMGDKGYVVTFRTIDPLFVFDLSDPRAPRVTGELKIPGFSNYLHPVGDGLILGIGMETRELFERDALGREAVVGFRQGGLKISLFDVSDMGKPKEITNLVIGESGSYSEALYNHKAVMVDAASQQVVFDAFVAREKDWNNSSQGALVISYKGRDIKQRGLLKYEEPEVYGKYIPYGRRAAYIGDTLYYIQDGIINAFDYDSLQKTGTLMLK